MRPQTIDQMLVPVTTPSHQYGFGIGIRREQAPEKPETTRSFWGHSGHWGSFMFYIPALRATITGTVNRADQNNRWIFEAVLDAIGSREKK